MEKTLFITINRNALVRNILRAGVLEHLLRRENLKIVLLLNMKISESFRREFGHPRVIVEEVKSKKYNRFRKIFIILFNQLVYSESERLVVKFGGGSRKRPSHFVYLAKHILFSIISRITFLKQCSRWIEQNIFIEKEYDYLFEKYRPDLVFCTSIYSRGLDFVVIKAAKRFGVLTVSMPKSWDTIGRLFYSAPSDKFIVNNVLMKNNLIKDQSIKEHNICVVGFPQFDAYIKKDTFLEKKEFCRLTGLDASKPIVLYASEGIWTYWDDTYIDDLVHNHKILETYNIILRPHYTDVLKKRYERFKEYDGLYVDDEHLTAAGTFSDAWDPTHEDIDWLANALKVSDVVITSVSTFVLDAMVFDKPIINICYDFARTKKDVFIPMPLQYNLTHFQGVMKRKPTVLARSAPELLEWLDRYTKNPMLLSAERKKTLEDICFKVDGRASERIAAALLSLLNFNEKRQ